MSKATAALNRACKKLAQALDETEYLIWDCDLAAAALSQEDFDTSVIEHEGNEHEARVTLKRRYMRDLRKMIADLGQIIVWATTVRERLPAVAAEQLAALEKFEYRGEDED